MLRDGESGRRERGDAQLTTVCRRHEGVLTAPDMGVRTFYQLLRHGVRTAFYQLLG